MNAVPLQPSALHDSHNSYIVRKSLNLTVHFKPLPVFSYMTLRKRLTEMI